MRMLTLFVLLLFRLRFRLCILVAISVERNSQGNERNWYFPFSLEIVIIIFRNINFPSGDEDHAWYCCSKSRERTVPLFFFNMKGYYTTFVRAFKVSIVTRALLNCVV